MSTDTPGKTFAQPNSVTMIQNSEEDCPSRSRRQMVPECVFVLFKVHHRHTVGSAHFVTPLHQCKCFLSGDFSRKWNFKLDFDGNQTSE